MIVNADNITEALEILKASPKELWSIDLETYNPYEHTWFQDVNKKQRPLNRINSVLVSLQLATPSGIEMYFDFNHKQEDPDNPKNLSYDYLPKIFEHSQGEDLIAHNAGFEYTILKLHGYDIPNDLMDTMIMGVLYNENAPQGLKPTVKRFFGHVMPSYAQTVGEGNMADITAVEGYEYGMSDATWTLKLYEAYAERIDMKYYRTFEMGLIKIIANNHIQGQVVDLDRLYEIEAEDEKARKEILEKFPELATLNFNSPAQVGRWLFTDLGLKPYKYTPKGNPSTDTESIFELEAEYGKQYPVLQAFADIKKIETRKKLYYKPYPRLIYPDGKLHSELRQTGTVTGRFSSNSPNLQQIAKRGEGVKVRSVFVPFEGHDCIVSLDWSQIEMRLAAFMSRDPKLLDGYRTNKDIHTLSGTNISGLPYEEMKKLVEEGDKEQAAYRQKGKTLNFAALYLAGANRLSKFDLLNCSEGEAEFFLAAHKEGYRGYFYDYVNSVKIQAKTNGYVKTLFGRKRRLPDINSHIKALRKAAENQALNFTIQGTAGDFMKLSLNSLDAEGLLFQKDLAFMAQIHDEFVFSGTFEAVARDIARVKEIMERVPQGFDVPLVAEVSVGKNFAEQVDIHDFSIEAIKEAVNA